MKYEDHKESDKECVRLTDANFTSHENTTEETESEVKLKKEKTGQEWKEWKKPEEENRKVENRKFSQQHMTLKLLYSHFDTHIKEHIQIQLN